MALTESKRLRILTFCALYFAQGVPWGFMLIALPAYLLQNYPVGDEEIGWLTGIILVPWSFKLIWAPLMDSFTIRAMGRRRPWIIFAQLMMAVSLLGFVGLGNPSEELRWILYMYFLHNCFASLQDVCTDALAVDILPRDEQGQMNGWMWGSKLVGKAAGATGLAFVLKYGGLAACVAVQVVLLLAIMLIPLLILERPGEKRLPWSAGNTDGSEGNLRHPLALAGSFLRAFSLTTLMVYVVFTLAKLIGVGVNEVVMKTLYIQHLRWTDVQFSTAAGLVALGPVILAALLGGLFADRFGRRWILIAGFGGYGLAAALFAACPWLWTASWFTISYLVLCEALYAVGSVGFLSMAMRISWTKASATVFTTYMTLSNVSHVAGNWLAGPVRTLFRFGDAGQSANMASYEWTFWFVAAISLTPLLLLVFVRPREVDRARRS